MERQNVQRLKRTRKEGKNERGKKKEKKSHQPGRHKTERFQNFTVTVKNHASNSSKDERQVGVASLPNAANQDHKDGPQNQKSLKACTAKDQQKPNTIRRRMTFSGRGPRMQVPLVPPKTNKVDPYLLVQKQLSKGHLDNSSPRDCRPGDLFSRGAHGIEAMVKRKPELPLPFRASLRIIDADKVCRPKKVSGTAYPPGFMRPSRIPVLVTKHRAVSQERVEGLSESDLTSQKDVIQDQSQQSASKTSPRLASSVVGKRTTRIRFSKMVKCRVFDPEGGHVDGPALPLEGEIVIETDEEDFTKELDDEDGETAKSQLSPRLERASRELTALRDNLKQSKKSRRPACTLKTLHKEMSKMRKMIIQIKQADKKRYCANLQALMFKMAPEWEKVSKLRFSKDVSAEYAKMYPATTPFTVKSVYHKLAYMNVVREFNRLKDGYGLNQKMLENFIENVLGKTLEECLKFC